ncbi:flavin monoamine oxidase family protein [Singulisphaera sp. PoT]|uniref:flavin monoamine oxidase family protein n=1 Tax=Singulisphaera sp. PoT TaxID=3411797 RepID=UPI003BF46D53
MSQISCDVLVAGAGYAGLSAARALKAAGRSVVLLESRDRVGGRTLERQVAGWRLELGGQYIAPIQERATKLVPELGLEFFTAWGEGDGFVAKDGKVARYQSTPARCLVESLGHPAEVAEEIEGTLNELGRLNELVPAATPWICPDAEAWDAVTFDTWINERNRTDASREFFRYLTNQAYSTEPGQISLLQMLWFLKTSHGLPPWAIGGLQANRVVGGTQLVAERMAEQLGDALHLGQIVRRVEQDDNGVLVKTVGAEYRAKAVVLCLPPQLLPGLNYEPRLPSDLYRAFSAFQTGNTTKVQAAYDRPFWRDKGLSGNGMIWDGPQTFSYDNSAKDGYPGVLLGFITARRATDWNRLSPADRRSSVLETWAKILGPEALDPIDYIEMDWTSEEFTRGGYGCHLTPGFWCELGQALGGESMPRFGRVWWAASDLAKDWNGYLEGGLFAGEQAAGEVDAFLG